jgi:hypothetical protein
MRYLAPLAALIGLLALSVVPAASTASSRAST